MGFVRIKDINAYKKLSVYKCSVNDPYDYFLIDQSAHLCSTSHSGNTKMKAR